MSCAAIAREGMPSPLRANGLSNRARQYGAKRRSRNHEGTRRPILEGVTQAGANDAADTDCGQPFGHAAERTSGAAVVLGQRPHAFGTGSQSNYSSMVPNREPWRYAFRIAPNTAMWLSTTRLRSASSGSRVQTPR